MTTRPRPIQCRSVYLPEEMGDEIAAEAKRLDRPVSWIVQRAWSQAREEIRRIPSMPKGEP